MEALRTIFLEKPTHFSEMGTLDTFPQDSQYLGKSPCPARQLHERVEHKDELNREL